MKRSLLTAAFLLFAHGVAFGAEAATATDSVAIAEFIEQLSSDQYAVRRRAEEELTRLGPAAHGQLKEAEQSDDIEVAERATYILQSMRVEWLRPQDPPEVRRALARFGDLSLAEKEGRIQILANLPQGQGFPALCRIARLEHLPRVARQAAIALLDKELSGDEASAILDACREELQTVDRPVTTWVSIWIREQGDRRATLTDWEAAIAAELQLFKEKSSETDFYTVESLLRRRLKVCHELKLLDETTNALMAIVELKQDDEGEREQDLRIGSALEWIVDHQRWDVLQQFYERNRGRIHGDRKLLYYYAAALLRAGREEEADKLAERAYQLKSANDIERITIAALIAKIGAVEWALREYQGAIDSLPPTSFESLIARRDASTWHHDRQDYKKASDTLAEFFTALQAKENRAARRTLLQQLDDTQYLSALEARQLLYLANYHHERKEYDLELETLEKAYRKYNDDPDILIAMYRLPDASDEVKQQTRERIAKMSEAYLNEIEASPEDPSKFNQWAWLVSNTEGDFAQAVKHSLHSLELSPDEPSYLDTLGRCYFSAGDVENALKAQQKAVELAPQYQIMRRQLAEFKKAKK